MMKTTKRLVIVGETLEDIDIPSILFPLPKVNSRTMTDEELAAFDAAYNEAQKPFFLEIEKDDPVALSHQVKPGDEIICYDINSHERIFYRLSAAKEGIFRFAMTSGSDIIAILRTLSAQERTSSATA